MASATDPVVIDLTVWITPSISPPFTSQLGPPIWNRIYKDLYQYTCQQSSWLCIATKKEQELIDQDLVVTDIRIGERPSDNHNSDYSWESRPGGIWLLRSKFSGNIGNAVTDVDVLFGTDAIDPRPGWVLLETSLQLDADPEVPIARLTVLRGRPVPKVDTPLRVSEDGRFRIVQISDTHMVTGAGVCRDAIDANGKNLPKSEADLLTVRFLGDILDVEKPDLVILTGDQLHHDISDSQTALFKVVAPIIKRSIPFAAVFGNHDDEGIHALSRTAQMSILQNLPFSLCEPGPEQVDGIGNFYLQVLDPSSQLPFLTIYFLDSHSETANKDHSPDYEPIKQSQINWFTNTSQELRRERENDTRDMFHSSLVFQHIPLPEFGDNNLMIHNGHRGEPTEGPTVNSHFYNALVKEKVAAIGCGHDHVNDFCGLLPQRPQDSDGTPQNGPWLCYCGGSGFGGYCSYGGQRYHRRVRVWELDTSAKTLKTWKRIEYSLDRIDELALISNEV